MAITRSQRKQMEINGLNTISNVNASINKTTSKSGKKRQKIESQLGESSKTINSPEEPPETNTSQNNDTPQQIDQLQQNNGLEQKDEAMSEGPSTSLSEGSSTSLSEDSSTSLSEGSSPSPSINNGTARINKREGWSNTERITELTTILRDEKTPWSVLGLREEVKLPHEPHKEPLTGPKLDDNCRGQHFNIEEVKKMAQEYESRLDDPENKSKLVIPIKDQPLKSAFHYNEMRRIINDRLPKTEAGFLKGLRHFCSIPHFLIHHKFNLRRNYYFLSRPDKRRRNGRTHPNY